MTLSGKKLVLREQADVYQEVLKVIDEAPGAGDEIEGPITSGTPVTLPSSRAYTDSELKIKLNGIDLTPVLDYNYVGSAPRTQVSFTFTLQGTKADPDVLEFRIDDELS